MQHSLLTNLVYNQTDRTQFILYTRVLTMSNPHKKVGEKVRHGGISDTSFILWSCSRGSLRMLSKLAGGIAINIAMCDVMMVTVLDQQR